MDISSTKKPSAAKVESESQVQRRLAEEAKARVLKESRAVDQNAQARRAVEQKKAAAATDTQKAQTRETRPRVSSEISQAMVQRAAKNPPPKTETKVEPEPDSRQTRAEAAKPIEAQPTEVSRDGAPKTEVKF